MQLYLSALSTNAHVSFHLCDLCDYDDDDVAVDLAVAVDHCLADLSKKYFRLIDD